MWHVMPSGHHMGVWVYIYIYENTPKIGLLIHLEMTNEPKIGGFAGLNPCPIPVTGSDLAGWSKMHQAKITFFEWSPPSDMFFDILSGIHILSHMFSDILSGISSEVLCGWGPAGNTLARNILSLRWRSGGEHFDPEVAVGVRRGTLRSRACSWGLAEEEEGGEGEGGRRASWHKI